MLLQITRSEKSPIIITYGNGKTDYITADSNITLQQLLDVLEVITETDELDKTDTEIMHIETTEEGVRLISL